MVKNIIFDFGGVIYDINFNFTYEKLRDLGIYDTENLSSELSHQYLFEHLEKGTITPGKFRNEVRKFSGLPLKDDQIDEAWNALLIGFRPDRIRLIEMVKAHYNIFLLSNSNIIHYQKYRQELEQQFGYKQFDELFIKAYFSFELGLIKPDHRIFKMVMDDQKLKPEETIFIDDTEIHTKSAAKTGLQVRHLRLDQQEDIIDLFDHKGVLKPG